MTESLVTREAPPRLGSGAMPTDKKHHLTQLGIFFGQIMVVLLIPEARKIYPSGPQGFWALGVEDGGEGPTSRHVILQLERENFQRSFQ